MIARIDRIVTKQLIVGTAFFAALFGLAGCAPVPTPSAHAGKESGDPRKKLVMLIAEPEYETARTLPAFAARRLAKDFRVVVVSGPTTPGATEFEHLEEIADADLLLVSVRRRTPPPGQLELIRRYVKSGRPVVGIRTASHAFRLMKGSPPDGQADWPDWDAEVIGGNYHNHYREGSVAAVTATKPDHAILARVALPFSSRSTLYKVSPLRAGTDALLVAAIPSESPEPVAWTFTRSDGGRTFYTSLGSPSDFENPSFQQLLHNGILWAASGPASP